jgi:hypothetical protein
MSKRSWAVDRWDFIVIDDITGIRKLRSECAIDGYGFLSAHGDPRHPQETPPIIREQMAAWPDPRPITANQYIPGSVIYFFPAYAVTATAAGVSSTVTSAPTVCLNAPLAGTTWYVDGAEEATGIVATLTMAAGSHSIRMDVVDELGNTGSLTFTYEQP